MSVTTILIADRCPRNRFALRALLGRQPGLDIVGEVAHGEDLLIQIDATTPEIVLLDWRLEGSETADLLAVLSWRCPSQYTIVLSGRPEDRNAALAAGADAFVSKVYPAGRLLAAIRSMQRMDAALTVVATMLQGAQSYGCA